MRHTRLQLVRWSVPALAAVLLTVPGDRQADAAVPLYQAFQIGGWFLCGGYCHAGYCCEIFPKPPVDEE